jgi:hypothetical protein
MCFVDSAMHVDRIGFGNGEKTFGARWRVDGWIQQSRELVASLT